MQTTNLYSELITLLNEVKNVNERYQRIVEILTNDGLDVSLEDVELNATYVIQGIKEGCDGDVMSSDWCVSFFYDAVEESTRLSVF